MNKAKKTIPLCIPEIGGNEWAYIKDCLDTNWVSSVGKYVDEFEQKLADYVGVKHGVACVNGTAAIHIALILAGVQSDQEVLVPAVTFIAPANAVRYLNAWPVFIDIDEDTLQIDVEKVVDFLTKGCRQVNGKLINKVTGRKVSAALPVHLFGHPVDLDPLMEICNRFGLKVIEDATESLGSEYKKKKTGSFGQTGCFSFNGNKIITTGGGGMLVTNDDKLASKARYLTTQAKDDPIEYIHNEIGYNYRLNNLQAAMGLAQLEQLEGFIAAKKKLIQRYEASLAGIKGLSFAQTADWAKPNYWLTTLFVSPGQVKTNKQDLLSKLRSLGIEARSLFHPLPSMKPFIDCFAYEVSMADRLYQIGINLPSSVGLSIIDQDFIIKTIKEAV